MKLAYPAIFTFYKEDKSYSVEFPDLPGCGTGGKDIVEAIEMAKDAASGWVLDEIENDRKVPEASDIHNVKIESKDSFVNIVVLEMDEYIAKYSKKSVRKNVTIPCWLNSKAEQRNINFSQVLQEALFNKLQLN